jgi:hypothetical protein
MPNPFTSTFGATPLYPAQVTYNQLNLSAAQNYALAWPIDNNTLSSSGVLGASLIFARIMDVNCTNASAILLFPNTALSGPGEQTVINNNGTQVIQVQSFAGTAIASVGPGIQTVFYSTPITASGWIAFQLGAAISVPSAAAIAGTGLKSIGGLLTQNMPATDSSTNNYTFTSTDLAKLYVWQGGTGTWNLPSTAAAGIGNGFYLQIKDQGSGVLTLQTNGTDTINGGSAGGTLAFNVGDSAFVVTDGSGSWVTIGLGTTNAANFFFTTISLAGLSGTYTLTAANLTNTAFKFTGALANNIQVVTPTTQRQYWVDNETSGGFTFTVGVAAQASPVPVGVGARAILYCDGVNIINGDTAGLATPVAVNQGGTGATTAAAARANLGSTATGDALFVTASVAAAQATLNVNDAGTDVAWVLSMS